ncbi:MAG: ACT domain-containing protein [Microthrixaceae bacterium]
MTGETDLATMLATLRIRQQPEPVTFVHLPDPVDLGRGVLALISEDEGTTVVVSVAEAERRGWPVEFRGAWLTVSVQSSLEAVGLTAELSAALAVRGIACNVLAGYHHDHLVVPLDRAEDAITTLEALGGR